MNQNWRGSLRIKIIAWSFVPTVFILSAVAWFTFFSYQQVLGDLALKQDWAVVASKVNQANAALSNSLNSHLRQVVLGIDTHPELPIDVRIRTILDQAQNLEDFNGGIYYVDPNGKVFDSYPKRPEFHGQDWSDTPQFRYIQGNSLGSSPVTDVQDLGPSVGKVVCAVLGMQNTQKELIGAGYYCYRIDPTGPNGFYELFNSLSLGQNVFFLDGNLQVVFSPDPARIGADYSNDPAVRQLLQGQQTSIRFRQGVQDKVISYTPFLPTDGGRLRWLLISERGWDEIMQPTLPYQKFLLVLLGMGVIVPVLVTLYGVRHITEPIQKIIRASERVTAGEFKQQIEVKTGDEIETLAAQFNRMSAELDNSYASLEAKVADRTRQLAILNSIISVAVHSLNSQEILEDALNNTVEQLGFDAGAAFGFQTQPVSVLLVAQQGLEAETAGGLMKRYDQTNPLLLQYPKEVTHIGVKDFQDETFRALLSRWGFEQMIYIPLSSMKDRELGFFVLGKRSPGTHSTEEMSLLGSIGRQIGVAMENAHLYEQAERTAILSERSRLARELHDAVTQTLFSASLIADVTPVIWKRSPEEGMQHLEELRQLTRGALAEMRTLLLEMRPESLDRADLKMLMTQLAEAFIGRVRIPVDLQIDGSCDISQEVKIVFYRVAQEALNNIAKHSGAKQVSLRLTCQPGQMSLSIQDDGLGFDTATIPPGHMGVSIMRERANAVGACLTVDSQPGQGTTVRLDWEA